MKALNKLGTERNFLNLTKPIYEKPMANIILNGKRVNEMFTLKIKNKTSMATFNTSIQHCTGVSSEGN